MNGFKVHNVGDHILLFVFDNKKEIEKIFTSEPWSFDKHLVVLQRFENNSPICELSFTWTSFWVQIYDIPFHYMNQRVAEDICAVIGVVDRTTSTDEMEGGSFMRVRILIDISLPLCRGRVLSLEDGGEVWVNFKYERLPNICYWCRCLTHNDRDCEVWINSDGTLKAGDQEYGPWLRAPFTPNPKHSMVVVPRYYENKKKNLAGSSRATEVSSDSLVRPAHFAPPVTMNVQPLGVMENREGLQDNSGTRMRDESHLEEGRETIHVSRGLAETQVQSACPLPRVQGEFLENQINEIDRGLSFFDTNDGAPSNVGLDMILPLGQNMRSDLASPLTPNDTNKNCISESNNSLEVSANLSDSGSLSKGGKVVSTRRRRVVRTVFDFVISNASSGAPVKRTNEANALEGLPRKRRMVSRQEKDGDLLMTKTGVQLRQEP